MSNPFYSPEDDVIDDDTFLNHPRAGSSGFMLDQHQNSSQQRRPQGGGGGGLMSVDERQHQLMLKKREIEQRTLDSTNKSLGLLYESEKVGVATGEELQRQKEQLLRTEGRLDDINRTLKTSERHLDGIKSVFGGIKNYLFAKKSGLPPAGSTPGEASSENGGAMSNGTASEISKKPQHYQPEQDLPDDMRQDNHPGLRTRGLLEHKNGGGGGAGGKMTVDDVLDQNLEEMSLGLSRLKGLAQDLNTELEDHNEILDRLDDKTAKTSWRVEKQNKDMSKLLKK